MPANLVLKSRVVLGAKRFADVVIWQLPAPLPGSTHPYKYRLAFVVDKVCVLRYDNEAGKGDHKHLGPEEVIYGFSTLDKLVDDFWADVARF
jgi:hypothetical protein